MDWHHIILVLLVILLTQCGNHMVRCVITDVRLFGGATSNKGTVEIMEDSGAWETTCGVNLDFNDVIVICRQLGFTGANKAIKDTPYGQNTTPTKGLNCNGDETDLSECTTLDSFSMVCPNAGGASCHVSMVTPTTVSSPISPTSIVFRSTPPPTTVADTSPTTTTNTTTTSAPSTFASTSRQLNVNTEVASTIAVGILLAFVTLYGIIITLMHLHLRRSNIALKQSVSDRVGQELDPYTSLDATTMRQPAYEDIEATRHGNRGHTNAIEGVEYENQTIVKQTARVKKSSLGVLADENTEPEYELPMEK